MRIILATPIYPPDAGGPATYTVELATRLRGTHHVVVVAYTDNTAGVPSTHLIDVSKKYPLPLRLFNYYRALVREAKQSDLIYVQNAVAAGLPAVLAGKRTGKPVILKFVGDEAWERATQSKRTSKQLEAFLEAPEGGWRTKIFMAIQKFVLRRTAVVTTPSAYLGELLVQYYGVKREQVVVNYNAGAEHDEIRAARKPHQVMTAVRLVRWKGVEGIITALTALVSKFPDVSLVVAGEGPEEVHLKKIAQKIPGWQEHITFAGRLSKTEVLKLQAESSVQVLNSTYEGMPHGVLESFATKTPIVATNIPGTREAVIDGETGLLVPPNDDQALAAAIGRLFTDEALRQRVTDGGSRILKEKFSWGVHLQTLEAMFKKAFAAEA